MVCKAEDGTEKVYKITVMVMPQYNGTVPKIEGVDAAPTPEPDDSQTNDTELEPGTEDDSLNDGNQGVKDDGIGGFIAIIVVIILIAALVYVLFFLNKRNLH